MMVTTATLLTTLSLALGQAGQLSASHIRTTFGPLGPTRPSNRILPGDLVCLSFDVNGFQVDPAGKVHYGVGLQVNDSKGAMVFKKEPSDVLTPNPGSGQPVPVCAKVDVGLASPPGKYDLKVTITDRTAGTTTSVTRSYEILPPEFGIVRISLTKDREGKHFAAAFSPGRPGWINFTAVGFGRDKASGQPHINATMRILDQDRRDVFSKPFSGSINQNVPAQAGAIPMQFELVLAQAGRFTVELQATDEITGRKTAVTVPIHMIDSK
jgi:hypothetical protein